MGHMSGFGGTLTLDTASNTEFGPISTGGSADIGLQRWTVTAETDTFEAYAKGDSFVETFNTGTRWRATIEALMESTMAATNLDIRLDGQAAKTMGDGTDHVKFFTQGDNYLLGKGFVTSVDFDDPLDGPVVVTIEMEGDGTLDFVSDTAP